MSTQASMDPPQGVVSLWRREPLLAAFSGFVFALGLGVSGMTRPDVVLGFLNLSGAWDPSLLFVMGGAATTTFFGYRLVLRRKSPLFGVCFHLPTRKDIDKKLVLGSALFGVGWGLGGICPGPGVVSTLGLEGPVLAFVAAMLVGMLVQRWWNARG